MGARRSHEELRAFARRMLQLLSAIAALLVVGGVALALAEDVDVWRGLLLSVDTVATVGSYAPPETTSGEIVRLVLVITGVGTLFYALVTVTEFFVAGHLGDLLAERRLQRMTDSLRDHVIICGYGRVGSQVVRDLEGAGITCVVIDEDPEVVAEAHDRGVSAFLGAASDDEVLRRAGIARAGGVVACVGSDAENVFITLSARELRGEGLLIVARAADEAAESKLRRAGADRVVSPYKASGAEIARLARHPQISGALGIAPGFRLDEIDVTEGCPAVGRAIAEVQGQAFVVGLRRDGLFVPRPPEDTRVEAGDVLVAMGSDRDMDALERRLDLPS